MNSDWSLGEMYGESHVVEDLGPLWHDFYSCSAPGALGFVVFLRPNPRHNR